MATSKITRVEVLKDHLGNRTGKVGILFEITKRGLWRFSHESPPIFVAPDGTKGRMTPAEDHPTHTQAPIGVGAPQSYWFIWNARGDGIDLLENDVSRWGYKIPLVNVMHGQEWAGSEPKKIAQVDPIDAFVGNIFIATTPTGSQTLDDVALGMDFDVNAPILVTGLGIYDSGLDGLAHDHTVSIYDRNTEAIIATAIVPAGTAATLVGGFRYVDLAAPILISAGFEGVIAAGYGSGNTDANGNVHGTKAIDPAPDFHGAPEITLVGISRFGSGAGDFPDTPDTFFGGGPANRYHAGSFRYLPATPDTPSGAPGFSQDATWDPQDAPGEAVSGATDDAPAFTRTGQRAPGVPQAFVQQAPSRNTYAEAPGAERPAIPVSQPTVASEDEDGNLLEAQTTPELAVFATPDSKQVAPDIPRVDEALGVAGQSLDVPKPGRRVGTPTKVPNQGSRTASLDPVPLTEFEGRVEGDALVSAPTVVASADAELICLLEPRVIPKGQFAAVSLLVKNRHKAACLDKIGLYVEVLFKNGTRLLIVNTPRNVNIGPGETAQASFHLEIGDHPVGPATVTAAVLSVDGQPIASVSKQITIAPEAFDPWAMGTSGPTQFTDDDRVPNEVKQIIDGTSPFKQSVGGSFFEHGQPFYFVVEAEDTKFAAALQVNGLAAQAGMTVRLRAGRMNGNTMDLGTFVESTQPKRIQGVEVLPGTHLAALGFSSLAGSAVAAGDRFWISVEPTAPIHSPEYNFHLHLSGGKLINVDATSAVRASDGQLDGTILLPWRSGVVALVNSRTQGAIMLLLSDGPQDLRDRALPVGSTLVVEPGDTIEVRHGGAYNNFSEVTATFTPDQETA